MVIESTRSECCLHVIKVAPYWHKEIHQMELLCKTFKEGIG